MWSLLLACAVSEQPDAPAGEDLNDVRLDLSVAEGYDFVIQTPDYVVPPHSDVMFCYWGTWTAPTAGIHYYEWDQSGGFGHHGMLNHAAESEEDFPDGSWIDCSTPDNGLMSGTAPLLQGTASISPAHGVMELPEGMAVKIEQGERWMFQSHYLNPTDQPLLVRDLGWGSLIAEEDVEGWVGSYTYDNSMIALPPQAESSDRVDCAWGQDLHILTMAGHMHGWGLSMWGGIAGPEEEPERIYELPSWDPAWRDAPQVVAFPDGGIPVKAEDRLIGECTWWNDTDEVLGFPTEMCVLMGLAYPLNGMINCDSGRPQPP
jgi:hypothetical protein